MGSHDALVAAASDALCTGGARGRAGARVYACARASVGAYTVVHVWVYGVARLTLSTKTGLQILATTVTFVSPLVVALLMRLPSMIEALVATEPSALQKFHSAAHFIILLVRSNRKLESHSPSTQRTAKPRPHPRPHPHGRHNAHLPVVGKRL